MRAFGLVPDETVQKTLGVKPVEDDGIEYVVKITSGSHGSGYWHIKVSLDNRLVASDMTETYWGARQKAKRLVKRHRKSQQEYVVRVE